MREGSSDTDGFGAITPGDIGAEGDMVGAGGDVADVFEVLNGDMNPVRLMERLSESSIASTLIIVHWSAHH